MSTLKAYSRELVDLYDHRHFGGASGKCVFQRDTHALQSLLGPGLATILDVPSGTGVYLTTFRELGYQVLGADASFPMVETTRLRDAGASGIQCGIDSLPFEENSFDVTLTLRLFSHFDKNEILEALQELRRVIRPGGRVIFDTFRWSPRQWPVANLVLEKSYMLPIASSDVEVLVSNAGLRVVDRRCLYLFSPIWYRKLPMWMLHPFIRLESLLPPHWLLRSFWACTKD